MIMDDGCLMWLFIRYMLLTQSLNMNMFVDDFVVFSKATRMPYKYALSMLWSLESFFAIQRLERLWIKNLTTA